MPDKGSFAHLHLHSEYSQLDGLNKTQEIVAAVTADAQTAVAITDHGTCAGHPDHQLACDAAGIKPIFGMEAYFVHDRLDKTPDRKNDYYHLVLWAMDDEGLKNLWAMSTESYKDGFYYKPRIDWDTLQRFNKGVMASTACLRGPVAHPYLQGDEDLAYSNLMRLMEIFDDDRLYVEIHVNHLEDQLKVNEFLHDVCVSFPLPPIAVVDSHYAHKEDQHLHRVWLSIQTDSDIADDSSLFAGGQDYHLMTEQEVWTALDGQGLDEDFIELAIANTVVVADRCNARIEKKDHAPIYSKGATTIEERVELDNEKLLEVCLRRWEERTVDKPANQDDYMARFEEEIGLIIEKKFAGYFLIVWDTVSYAKNKGVLMSPARGSGGGSLVAYLQGITELDPVEYDILFARFMTKGRTELPDFDLDFPSSKKELIFNYSSDRWGANHVAAVGTHTRLKSKSAVQAVARAMSSSLPEDHWTGMVLPVSAIIDAAEADTAGLGLSWEDLWARAGEELEPYLEAYPEFFEIVTQLHGRLKSYGRHPAGVIIDPDNELTANLPLRAGEDGQMVAQFDLKILELLGYTKFDYLNLRNLDTLQMTVDSIEKSTGRRIDPYSWRAELEDPYIYEQLSEGWTLGCFQIETQLGTEMCRNFQPRSLREMADVITLVRPGPRRSGLTKAYLQRRDGAEEVTYPDPRMEAILSGTQGAMIYQEQLMNLCMTLALYTDVEADHVRRILGKKKLELAKKEKPRFIERAVANGTAQDVADDLWAQMEEFAKYSFGQGHAMGYAMLSVWTAWFKFHYPLHFLCAALSTVKAEMIPSFVEEARRMGYQVLPPDVNESGVGFSIDSSQMAVRYGLDSIKGIGPAAVDAITTYQPYITWEDFAERKGPKCNSGSVKTLARIGAFDSLAPNRKWLEKVLEVEGIAGSDRCEFKAPEQSITWLPTPTKGMPPAPEELEWELPCSFDWVNEPAEPGRTGKPKKRKAPPKKCTRGCRNYTPFAPPDSADVIPYTDEEIRNIEVEHLGVYLSSTPFERIPDEDREKFATALEVLTGPHGTYPIAAVVKRFRTAKKRSDMGFLTLVTERGELDCVVFPKMYERFGPYFKNGSLAYATVTKNDRGQALDLFMPIDD